MDSITVDLSTLPPNVPSMCIPRVFKNITEERVRRVLEQLNLGDVERVDMVPKRNDGGDEFQRVFIHFKRWYKNADADKARERLLTGKEIKIVYDDPWFWKISANRSVSGDRSRGTEQRRGPALEFDSPRDQRPPRDQRLPNNRRDYKQRPPRDFLPRERDPRREQQRVQREMRVQSEMQSPVQNASFVPRSPDNSPPRARETSPCLDVDSPSSTHALQAIDYGDIKTLPVKKRRVIKKPPATPQEEVQALTQEQKEK